jgi:hypothetical protein
MEPGDSPVRCGCTVTRLDGSVSSLRFFRTSVTTIAYYEGDIDAWADYGDRVETV